MTTADASLDAPLPSSAATPRATRRAGDLVFGVNLFGLALGLRLAAAFAFAAEPVWDGQYYDFGAKRIAAGLGYSDDRVVGGATVWHPWCHYPVGYSAYLSVFYKLFGASHVVTHVADGLAGALLAVAAFVLAREALSPARAKLAGLLVALHPGLVLYGGLVMSEPLSALLVLGAFWAAVRTQRAVLETEANGGERRAGWLWGPAAGGLVLGVAALVRPQALLCAPFLALTANVPAGAVRGFERLGRRSAALGPKLATWLAGAAVASACALVVVSPWTARNCRVMDGCALVSTNAGWNLAIGAFPRATGRFETLRSDDGCREVTGQVQQDRCWFAYGLAHIREAPLRWLGLVPAKLAYTFDHESFPVEYLHEARPAAWPEPRRAAAREALTTAHRILLTVAALGTVALWLPSRRRARVSPDDREAGRARVAQTALLGAIGVVGYAAFAADRPAFWPIALVACLVPWLPLPGRPKLGPALLLPAALVLTTAAAHAVFFGEDRYHMVATPALCILAAAALRSPVPRRRAGDGGCERTLPA